jgi:hypothetical protein
VAVKRFPAGSAGELDGLRPQHQAHDRRTYWSGWSINADITDRVHQCLSIWSSAAVGCTLRRIVAKAACSAVRDCIYESLALLQLRFAVKHGAEAAAHAARCYINNIGPDEAFVKIDIINAFNAISCDEVFRSAEEITLTLE